VLLTRVVLSVADNTAPCRIDTRCSSPGAGLYVVLLHLGGLTCECNLGRVCRRDHQLKQLPGWTLTQPEPGVFAWITPAGRTYTTGADPTSPTSRPVIAESRGNRP
jgi:hypothetical protein